MYQHVTYQQKTIDLPATRAVCVGRNYLDHIAEMGSRPSEAALLFMKPLPSLVSLSQPVAIPLNQGACHNELEIAVLLKQPLRNASHEEAMAAVWGVGLALDLTLRDCQAKLKADAQPWERAKAFDGSCPVSGFVPVELVSDLTNVSFSLRVDGDIRQSGNSGMMIRRILDLLVEMSQAFTLMAGDIILTGTPAGVGPLEPGQRLQLTLAPFIDLHTQVVGND